MITWLLIFIISLFVLIKSSGWLLLGAERAGLSLRLPPFIIGVAIVGIGTSLPELASSLVAIYRGVPEIVVANVLGSNIANILFVAGLLAIISKKIQVEKSLIDLDLPLLGVATTFFIFAAYDGFIHFGEAVLLIAAYVIYLGYVIKHRDESETAEIVKTLPEVDLAPKWWQFWRRSAARPYVRLKDALLILIGSIFLAVSANYVINSAVELSRLLNIAPSVIAMLAIAFGTSLPELVVSYKAARLGESEVALGNIIGSCVFNILMVVGVSGFITALPIGLLSLTVGLPFLVAATILFIISGVSRRIYLWEGSMFLLFYVFFIGKLTGYL